MNDTDIAESSTSQTSEPQRKVIVSNFVSLDGCYARPNGEIDWSLMSDEEVEQYAKGQFDSIDTILFGRKTYELMEGYWPTPAAAEEDPVFTEAMNELPKIVFSKTLESVDWNNSRLAAGSVEEEVTKLKNQPGKDIVIFGSGSIVQTLTNVGLIDEYRLFVHPIILGSGKSLFENIDETVGLSLEETRQFENGVVVLDYQKAEVGVGNSS